MLKRHSILPTRTIVSLLHVQEKLKERRSSKLKFSSSCFIADDSHVKTVWLHAAVFSENDTLHF